jgi:hypothetical protein
MQFIEHYSTLSMLTGFAFSITKKDPSQMPYSYGCTLEFLCNNSSILNRQIEGEASACRTEHLAMLPLLTLLLPNE